MRGSKGLASLGPFLGAPAGSPGQVKYAGGTGSGAWHPLTPSWVPVPQIMRYVEVEQLVQFLDKVDDCPLLSALVLVQTVQHVQFWTRLMTCPLLCKLGVGPDSAQFVQFLDQVVDMPVIVQRQVYLVGQSRRLWKSRSCNALIRGRCPCCAGRRLGLVEGATDSVHRQSLWTFQFSSRLWVFSEGMAVILGWAFFALLRVVPELSASFWSPR